MIHYLFVGYYVEQKTFDKILNNQINNMSVARQNFEYNLIKGLSEVLADNIDFVSYVPTDGTIKIPSFSLIENTKINHIDINKKDFKSMRVAAAKFEEFLLKIGEHNYDCLNVLMYAINPIFEYILLKYKRKYRINLVTICSEVPSLRRYGNSLAAKLKKSILTFFNEKFDGYIFFSDHMKDVVKCNSKPFIVLEGIAPEIRSTPRLDKKNIIMYAGGLANDNQIPYFLECCMKIHEIDEIWICGSGQDENKVSDLSKIDHRIKYFGRLDNDKVLELESKAKFLINFRSPNEKLTKYSFPSKILEYISSGGLVLSTKLEGIPKEYFDYIVPIDFTDKDKIINSISAVLTMSDQDYFKRCESSQKFIEQKNYKGQTYKVLTFLDTFN